MDSGHETKTPTAPSDRGLFVFGRLVQVSKNYRSVIRACMEDMHQAASKLVCSLTEIKINAICDFKNTISIVSYYSCCKIACVDFRHYQDSISILKISKLVCKSGRRFFFFNIFLYLGLQFYGKLSPN